MSQISYCPTYFRSWLLLHQCTKSASKHLHFGGSALLFSPPMHFAGMSADEAMTKYCELLDGSDPKWEEHEVSTAAQAGRGSSNVVLLLRASSFPFSGPNLAHSWLSLAVHANCYRRTTRRSMATAVELDCAAINRTSSGHEGAWWWTPGHRPSVVGAALNKRSILCLDGTSL